MKLVIVESPFGANPAIGRTYGRAALADCLARGESPIASHLLYTQPGVLRDTIPEQRALGIAAGHAWFRVAELCVVYCDYGVSQGMQEGIAAAGRHGVPIEFRTLGV